MALREALKGFAGPIRRGMKRWWDESPDLQLALRVVGLLFVLGLAIRLAEAAWGAYGAGTVEIRRLSARFLFLILLLLSAPPWWFWLAFAGAIAWTWSYRRNCQRQEAIIDLLLEIREKLG